MHARDENLWVGMKEASKGTFTVPWRTQVGLPRNEASTQAKREREKRDSEWGIEDLDLEVAE